MYNNLELRMYGLVPYNISPIQQGIQFGHAVVEYCQKIQSFKNGPLFRSEHYKSLYMEYNEWADNWKTFIILNGGTTNNKIVDGVYVGSLNNHKETLDKMGVFNVTFNEPDLGDQLTGVVFIVDERVFNKKKYPDFEDWVIENFGDLITGGGSAYQIARRIKESKSKEDQKVYLSWVKLVGGEKNAFLRDFLKNFRLA
jgi:hypothetical protein